jgi:hypothetical protein
MEHEIVKAGELYVGIVSGENGDDDYHLVRLPIRRGRANWHQAHELAREAGGELPTRDELAIMAAECGDKFSRDWFWSSELDSEFTRSGCCQSFTGLGEGFCSALNKQRWCAVRRVKVAPCKERADLNQRVLQHFQELQFREATLAVYRILKG